MVFDPATKTYHYATLSADGSEFESTGKTVGKTDPRALGLRNSITIKPEARAAKARRNFEEFDAVVKQRAQWEALKEAKRNFETFKKEVKKQEKAGRKGLVIPMGTIFPDSDIPAAPAEGDSTGSAEPPPAPAPPSFTLAGDVVGLTASSSIFTTRWERSSLRARWMTT